MSEYEESTTVPAPLARLITAARTGWLVALVGLLLGVGLIAGLGEAEHTTTPVEQLAAGSDSAQAAQLRDRLPDKDSSTAIVLFTTEDGSRLDRATLGGLAKAVTPYLPEGATRGAPAVIPSEDGQAAIGIVPIDTADASETKEKVEALRADLATSTPDGIRAEVTGPAGIQTDLAKVFDGANTRLLLATALVVAFLLIVTYRSPVLWVIPLLVIGVADRLATVLATHTLDATGIPWDESTTGILSVLVFGAGTDYALLLISRYRDELRHAPETGDGRRAALATATRATAHAVVASATTVVVGVLTLLLSVFPTTRGLGLACAVGIVVAAVFALIVLPAVLSLFGRWIFWPRVPHDGEPGADTRRSLWHRVGTAVRGRPGAFAAATTLLLVLLAAGLGWSKLGLPRSEQFLARPEALVAADRLAEHFPAGASDPASVVTTADAREVTAAIKDVEGVSSVTPVASGGGVTELQVVLDDDPSSPAAAETVTRLRNALADHPGSHVGGSTAEDLDTGDGTQRDRLVVLPLILALVLGALVLLLRSLAAPLILVATVVATYLAALGASWWIFAHVFGFSGIVDSVPLLAFLFLVALGVDYNIFLVTRALEESRSHGHREGMLRALSATGGVITSAGILLAAVFAVLGVLPLVVLAQLGTVICVGVLLDTLLVRTVLVPAIAWLVGERFWWPRKV